MSAPNKGKDLSALKARLANKAGVAAPASEPTPPTAPEPPSRVPSRTVASRPGGANVAPSSSAEPSFSHEQRHEPRAAVKESAAPVASAASKRAAASLAAEVNEFSGEAGTSHGQDPFAKRSSFDPGAGLIGGGEDVDVRSKLPLGLIGAAAIAGLLVGGTLGWVGHSTSEKRGRVDVAVAKAAEMSAEVTKIKNARAALAVGWQEISSAIEKDPVQGAEKLNELVRTSFQEHPKIDALFGWQLASMGKPGIRAAFNLYENASGLLLDIGRLSSYLQNQAGALKDEAGPARLAVTWKDDDSEGANLVELVKPLCGTDIKAPEECAAGKPVVGYAVRAAVGGSETNVEKANVRPVLPRGPIYNTVISSKPAVDARRRLEGLIGEVGKRLEEMSKHEKAALDALARYSESPTVDGQTAQPDAAGE